MAGESSGAAWEGSPTSSRTASPGCSSSRAIAEALASALVRALSEPGLAAELGAAARVAVEPWLATPEDYARRMRELVDEVAGAA